MLAGDHQTTQPRDRPRSLLLRLPNSQPYRHRQRQRRESCKSILINLYPFESPLTTVRTFWFHATASFIPAKGSSTVPCSLIPRARSTGAHEGQSAAGAVLAHSARPLDRAFTGLPKGLGDDDGGMTRAEALSLMNQEDRVVVETTQGDPLELLDQDLETGGHR